MLVFGTFDPLHEGHRDFFRQARSLGTSLTVVVARDRAIYIYKHRPPYVGEEQRLAEVAGEPTVDSAILGDDNPAAYDTLQALDFEVLALGYDQAPSDREARVLLNRFGKHAVHIHRLAPYRADEFKSSRLRNI